MCINIDGPSLDNLDTGKFVSDCIESTVTSRHLNGHNSSRTETHEEADGNVVLKGQNKTKTFEDYFGCIHLFFLTLMMRSYFSALVDTIEARMLYFLLQKLFFFCRSCFQY